MSSSPGNTKAGWPADREQHDAVDKPPSLVVILRFPRVLVHIDEEARDPGHTGEVRRNHTVLAREVARDASRHVQITVIAQRAVKSQADRPDPGAADAPVVFDPQVALMIDLYD
jgi:hypothetical protein